MLTDGSVAVIWIKPGPSSFDFILNSSLSAFVNTSATELQDKHTEKLIDSCQVKKN